MEAVPLHDISTNGWMDVIDQLGMIPAREFLTHTASHTTTDMYHPNTYMLTPTHIGGKRAYGPGSFGPLVPVAEPGSITRDQCRSRFQHEPGPRGLHMDALRREGAWVIGPGS
jgi:hypothetical protein